MNKWAALGNPAARVRISKALFWWRFQEYGTAPYKLKPDPNGQYEFEAAIWRRDAAALHFEIDGKEVITTAIHAHPGIPPRHMVESARPLIRDNTQARFEEAVKRGVTDNPQILNDLVLESTTEAKDIIRDSFELHLSDAPREYGRLKGRTAAQAFEADATVVKVTE